MIRSAVLVALWACGCPVFAIAAAPVVPGFERFLATPETAAEGGALLLGELNCTACHPAVGAQQEQLVSKVAPHLSHVGQRVRHTWLKKYLADPHAVKPGTMMPDVLAGLPAAERDKVADDLTAFLTSTSALVEGAHDTSLVAQGKELFHQVGCVACHDPANTALATSIPLGNIADKYSALTLEGFLKDPLAVRPSARMPSFAKQLTDDQWRALVAWFFRDAPVPTNLRYSLYTGAFSELPDFSTLTPEKTGESSGFDLGLAGRDSNYAMVFEGWFFPPTEGNYIFRVASDDGTKLYLDDTLIMNHDGLHPAVEKDGRQVLAARPYKFRLEYFQGGGGQELRVDVQGPKIKRRPAIGFLGLTPDAPPTLAAAQARMSPENTPSVHYEVYHGEWQSLPDFSKLTPVSRGESAGLDLGVAQRDDSYAMVYQGYFHPPFPGEYRFAIRSDDGARVLVNGQEVVENNGVHDASGTRTGAVALEMKPHLVRIEYFEHSGQQELQVNVEGPGVPESPVARWLELEANPEHTKKTPPPGVQEQIARGKAAFSKYGCANCHEYKESDKRLAGSMLAGTLATLKPNAGCLAPQPSGTVPRYQLSEAQRQALNRVVGAKQELASAAPVAAAHRQLATQNCYACHTRRDFGPPKVDEDGDELPQGWIGGPEDARKSHFTTVYPEMGDEGRLPPSLAGVTDKLRPDWIAHIAKNGADDRQNYMRTRMPQFGEQNLKRVFELMAEIDPPVKTPRPELAEAEYRMLAHGRYLTGGKAISCIKCHDFGPHPSIGIRALNLTTITKRLREDWFRRHLPDPQTYRPGTRMPTAWPFGQAAVKDVLEGSPEQQISAIWLYLKQGEKAPVPSGLLREPIELKPDAQPVLYRNFIEGGGSRAIGVGYPELLNVAWDANDMRLAMIWHGAFIDAARHWTGRGQGYEAPLGDHVLRLTAGAPFAVLDQPELKWPGGLARENGYRFLGYQLDAEGRPAFRYRWQEMTIREELLPEATATAGAPALRRTIYVETGVPDGRVYYRVAAAGKITPRGEQKWQIDEGVTISIEGPTGRVRESEGRKELLIPFDPTKTPRQFRMRYEW